MTSPANDIAPNQVTFAFQKIINKKGHCKVSFFFDQESTQFKNQLKTIKLEHRIRILRFCRNFLNDIPVLIDQSVLIQAEDLNDGTTARVELAQ